MSTRGRLALLAMLAVAPALAFADIVLLASLSGTAGSEVDHDLVAQATLLQTGIDDANGHPSFGGTVDTGPVTVNAVIVAGGRVVASSGTSPLPPAAAVAFAARSAATRGVTFGDASSVAAVPQRVYATPLGSADQVRTATLVVNRSVADLRAAQGQTLLIALLLSSGTIALTGLVARHLAGRVLRPVRTIAHLARTISEKDLHRRVTTAVPPDELGDLVATFNAMLSRLEADFEGLKRFTADASHELRAPLAIMRTELELSLSRHRATSDYRQSQRHLLRDVQHLTRIADRLLLLARSDAGTLVMERTRVDVTDLVTETVERWRPAAARRRVVLWGEADGVAAISADSGMIREVLDNLVDNAVKHAPAASTVTVRAAPRDDGMQFDVVDEGSGVPDELRPLLFTRFFGTSAARTPGAPNGGSGLGLAVSASIARAHGGHLSYVAMQRGATFRLWLPTTTAPGGTSLGAPSAAGTS